MVRHRPSLFAVLAIFVAFSVLTPWNAVAQVLYGSIVGQITDASGAPVPGAAVTITNRDTGLTRTAVTQRNRRVFVHERSRRPLQREGLAPGLQGIREDRRAGLRQRGEPRRRGAGHRRADRHGDGRVAAAAAADRQGRHAHRDQVGGDHPAAAAAEPELPDADQSGTGRDAGARSRTAKSTRRAAR